MAEGVLGKTMHKNVAPAIATTTAATTTNKHVGHIDGTASTSRSAGAETKPGAFESELRAYRDETKKATIEGKKHRSSSHHTETHVHFIAGAYVFASYFPSIRKHLQ